MIVGCIDPFDPKILEMIRGHLPDGWKLIHAQGESKSEKIAVISSVTWLIG